MHAEISKRYSPQTTAPVIQMRQIDKTNIQSFISKTYTKKKYTVNAHGQFDLSYSPTEHKSSVTLPVKFINFPQGSKIPAKFCSQVQGKWSKANIICTTADPAEWKTALNPISINVEVQQVANENEAYFKINYDSNAKGGHDCVDKGTATLSEEGYTETMDYYVYDIDTENDAPTSKACALKGTLTTHHKMVQQFMGAPKANQDAVMDSNRQDDSVMASGATVLSHHYVTFLMAMVEAIKAGTSNAQIEDENYPNKVEDWEIK